MGISITDLAKIGQITTPTASRTPNGGVFNEIYQNAIAMLDETNSLQKNADQMSIDFAMGKIDNIHDVMIAQEKAYVALQYTVQLRNAVLDAYNEIMRLQI